jgi:hypothetical protein
VFIEKDSKMEAVTEFGGDQSWVVKVEAADGYGVILQDAVVGDVDGRDGEFPALADVVAC